MELLPQPLSPDQATPFPEGADPKFISKLEGDLLLAFNAYEAAWREDHDRMFKCYEDFASVTTRRVSKLFSNLTIPTVYTAIRILEGRISDAVLATNPLVDVFAEGQIGPNAVGDIKSIENKAGILKEVLNGLVDSNNGRLVFMQCILDGLIYGRMIAKTGWEVRFTSDGAGYTVEREYPVTVRISPSAFMIDPRAKSVETSVRTFETMSVTKNDSSMRVEQGLWDEKVASGLQFDAASNTLASEFQRKIMDSRHTEDVTLNHETTDVVECMTRIDPDGNGQKTMYTIWFIPQTGKVLGFRPCLALGGDRRPVAMGYLFPSTADYPHGVGVVEVVRGMARAKSSIGNQALDNAKVSANARTLVNTNAFINESELKNSMPGGIIHGDDITASGIGIFQAKPVTSELLALGAYLDNELQSASSVTDIAMAMKAPSTAFATGLVAQQSQANFDIMATFAKSSFFDELFDQLLHMTQKFLDMKVPATIDVMGQPAPVWVNRHALQGNFRARCNDLRVAGKRKADAQILMSIFSLVAQAGAQFNLADMVRYLLNKNDTPQSDIDRLVPPGATIIPQQASGGVPGQPNPNEVGQPGPADPNSQRVQMRPGPGGDMPAELPMGQQMMQ